MKIMRTSTLWFALILVTAKGFAQEGAGMLPKIIEKNGRHVFLVDGKPFFMLGGQAHNSSGWPGMMSDVWAAVRVMHANTVEVPIYWEQIEARQGVFDLSLIDTLLVQAREQKVRLVLLWFATWKNGSNHYMPEWMKRDALKYPNITGKDGKPVDSPSPHSEAALAADIKAFTIVMRYLKKQDARHTVIMVQVENESGSWGSVRDFSPAAQKLFEGAVPDELLKPEVLRQLNHTAVSKGTWTEVFGNDADEYFHAWSVARYIGQVAAAGRAEYPLPMYVNAALRDPLTHPSATTYESGGPTDNVIPIWKAAAPAIDLVAPDIYISGSERIEKVIDLYDRHDNALFVPETGGPDKGKYLYEVIAHGGIGFSPFGIDDNGQGAGAGEAQIAERLAPYAQEYAMAAPMMRELAQWGFEGKIRAAVEREDSASQTVDLGVWQAIVSFGGGRGNFQRANARPNGKMMIVQLDENRFVVTGTLSHITFRPTDNSGRAWQYLKVEEGRYENGIFKPLRILNGDETDWGGPRFGANPTVLQISLILR